MGGPEFFGVVKEGGQFFFQWTEQNIPRVKKGGPKFFLLLLYIFLINIVHALHYVHI